MPSTRVRGHLGRRAEVEVEFATLGAFLHTVRHETVNRIATKKSAGDYDSDSVLICGSQSMIPQWFCMGIFRVLRRMLFNPILSLLAITLLAELDWDATRVKRFPFGYQRPKFVLSVLPLPWWGTKRPTEQKAPRGTVIRFIRFVRNSLLTAVCLAILLSGHGNSFLRRMTIIGSTRCWKYKTDRRIIVVARRLPWECKVTSHHMKIRALMLFQLPLKMAKTSNSMAL